MGSPDSPCSERIRASGSDLHYLLGAEIKWDSDSRYARLPLLGAREGSLHESPLHLLLNLRHVGDVERGDAERREVHARKNLRIRALDPHQEMGRPNLFLFLPKSGKECPVENRATLVRQSIDAV